MFEPKNVLLNQNSYKHVLHQLMKMVIYLLHYLLIHLNLFLPIRLILYIKQNNSNPIKQSMFEELMEHHAIWDGNEKNNKYKLNELYVRKQVLSSIMVIFNKTGSLSLHTLEQQ